MSYANWRGGTTTMGQPHMGTGGIASPGGAASAAGAVVAETSGPRAKCDQVIFEAIAKACELIVSGRGGVGGLGTGGAGGGTAGGAYPYLSVPSNNHGSSSSSRFNLQIAEIQSVRSILHVYRLTLHVPIRLDVYYQHEGDRRELLERWCLEYRPAPMERFLQAEGVLTQDPIAQLRHVCKRIVIWLRTLYCWTRLLPAQAFPNRAAAVSASSGWAGGGLHQHGNGNSSSSHHHHPPIGFSIYVNAEGKDDISDLTTNQGFHWQGQPSPVVTPYGELGWKVIYSPAQIIERLLPIRPPLQHQAQMQQQQQQSLARTQSASRPIPVQNWDGSSRGGQNAGFLQGGNHYHNNNNHGVPQSAPAQFADKWSPLLHSNDGGGTNGNSNNNIHQQPRQNNNLTQNTYDSSQFYHRRLGQQQPQQQQLHHPPAHGVPLQRRHTSIGQERSALSDDDDYEKYPERIMSGLSLALMMVDNNEASSTTNQDHDEPDGGKSTLTSTTTTTDRRRAALHEVPAYVREHHQLQQQQQHHQHQSPKQPTTQGEYGYGYNNHIPWKKIQPSNTTPTLFRSPSDVQDGARLLGTSPSAFLASTPPSGAFLGGAAVTPSGANLAGGSRTSQLSVLSASSAAGAVPPPFQSRPAGFVQEAPQYDVLMRPLPQATTKPSPEDGAALQAGVRGGPASLPPLTSMDLLHSSPFQQPPSHGSLLSSLTIGTGTGYGVSTTTASGMATSHSADLVRSLWNTSSSAINPVGSPRHQLHHHHPYYNEDDYDDEMPFVVDDNVLDDPMAWGGPLDTAAAAADHHRHPLASATTASTAATASLTSSAVASLAQRCSHSTRLKIFERSSVLSSAVPSMSTSSPSVLLLDESISGMTDQLADFHSFGAALRASSTTSSSHQIMGTSNTTAAVGGGGGGGGLAAAMASSPARGAMTTTVAGGTSDVVTSGPSSQPLPARSSTPISLRP